MRCTTANPDAPALPRPGHGDACSVWAAVPPMRRTGAAPPTRAEARPRTPAADREAELRDLRLRDARHRPRLQADQPELVRHVARHQAADVRERVRRGQQHVRRRASEPPRRRVSTPTALGELKTISSSSCSAPASTRGRRPSVCVMPTASSARSAPASTWSPFMDIDVFPNSLEYWGPTGMVFFRNVQARWMPIKGD